jgi:hypothetical protein
MHKKEYFFFPSIPDTDKKEGMTTPAPATRRTPDHSKKNGKFSSRRTGTAPEMHFS